MQVVSKCTLVLAAEILCKGSLQFDILPEENKRNLQCCNCGIKNPEHT